MSTNEALELCKRWLADGADMTAYRRDVSPLRTHVEQAPRDWFEAVLLLARDPAHAQDDYRLGWPLAMVMEPEAKDGAAFERLCSRASQCRPESYASCRIRARIPRCDRSVRNEPPYG